MTRIAGKKNIFNASHIRTIKIGIVISSLILVSTVLYQFKALKDERDYFMKEAKRLSSVLNKRESDFRALLKTNKNLFEKIEYLTNDPDSSCTLRKALGNTWTKYKQITVDFCGKVSNKVSSGLGLGTNEN